MILANYDIWEKKGSDKMSQKLNSTYRVTLFDDKNADKCSTMVDISSEDYEIFCNIVDFVQKELNKKKGRI